MAKRKETKKIIIHCADTPPSMDIGAEDIDRWHKERGWKGIGYHFVIRRDGTIELGRPLEDIGAHTKGHNSDSVAICLVGGRDEKGEWPLKIQKPALCHTLVWLSSLYRRSRIYGHNELSSKPCPNFDVTDWVFNKTRITPFVRFDPSLITNGLVKLRND